MTDRKRISDVIVASAGHNGLVSAAYLARAGVNVVDQITKTVMEESAHYYTGLEELEVGRRALALPDIEERFHAIDGSVYHVDPLVTRFGPAKPAWGFGGYSTPVPGLFLTGSGTHPAADISGMPGQNAANTMLKAFAKQDKHGITYSIAEARAWDHASDDIEPMSDDEMSKSLPGPVGV